MAYFGKDYTFVKDENFDGFLRSNGVPESHIAAMSSYKPTQKFTQSGDSYTVTTSSPKGLKTTTFKSGVEFEDSIGEDNTPIKSTYTVDGNTITQIIKGDNGTATFKREFSGNDLVVTITGDKFDGIAKRYYKA